MSTAGQLILVHAGVAIWIAFCVANLRGPMARWTWKGNRATFLRHVLLPGKLATREVWIRQQKIISWFGLAFAVVWYALVMFRILA